MSSDPKQHPKYLAISHPDYRFPPSRNPYWSKVKAMSGFAYSDADTEIHRGKWLKAFKSKARSTRSRKLHVEIGCNAGHVTVEWAARDPKNAYIGLDFKVKAIYRAAEKAAKRELDNLIFLRAPAQRLAFIFGPEEVDHFYVFFPDPWPKKAHWKNRFINAEHLKMLSSLLKKDGVLHIKTDHPGYFKWMLEAIEETRSLWEVEDKTHDLHAGHPEPKKLEIPDVTLFEKLFIKDGIPIQSVKLRKK